MQTNGLSLRLVTPSKFVVIVVSVVGVVVVVVVVVKYIKCKLARSRA